MERGTADGRRAVDATPPAIGQRRAAPAGLQFAADQRRDQHQTPVFRQSPGVLGSGRHAVGQPAEGFGRLIRVGYRNYARGGSFSISVSISIRQQQQAFAVDLAHDRPADGKDLVAGPASDLGGLRSGRDEFQAIKRNSRVAHAQDVGQPLTIGLNRPTVSLGGRKISLPVFGPLGDRGSQLLQQKLICAVDETGRQIAGPRQRLGTGKGLHGGFGFRRNERTRQEDQGNQASGKGQAFHGRWLQERRTQQRSVLPHRLAENKWHAEDAGQSG